AFVANSMGCQIVTELAVHLPGRVGPLVLVGPTVDPQRRAARHQLLGGLRDAAREPRSLLGIAARDDAVVGVGALLATARSALALSTSSSARKASRQDASSPGASHIGTCPQWRRTSREPGRTRCHSAAIRAGRSRS